MIKKLLCAVALLVGGALGAMASPVLSVSPSANNVTVGTTFSVDIRITGVTDLYGWQLDLNFGPSGLLNASPATEGSFFGGTTSFFGAGTVDNTGGTITSMFNALSGSSGVNGDGILASLSFEAIGEGTATLSLMNVLLSNSNLDDIFFSWPDNALSAAVNISRDGGNFDLPEPTTLALLALALAGAAVSRRKV